MSQHLRRSQFILTYGPGAILEGQYGPRLIPAPDSGVFGQSFGGRMLQPADFEIFHERMSRGLLSDARIFRVPSNAELCIGERYNIYKTKAFPTWSLCVTHGILYRSHEGCPHCFQRSHGRREAIRFVRACPKGHLDDVDWNTVIHENPGCQGSNWYEWCGGGSSLRDVIIRCPRCGQRNNLGRVYQLNWPCSGRFPEREPLHSPPYRPGCETHARIIQRQASNLRIPEIVSLFTIPPRYTELHRLLENPVIRAGLAAGCPLTLQDFQNILNNLVRSGLISASTVRDILQYEWAEIQQAIGNVMKAIPDGFSDLLLEEFQELITASITGVPPVTGRRPDSPVLFEVILRNVQRVPGPQGKTLRVVPISRLNTLMVQRGYRRLEPDPLRSTLVDVSFTDQQRNRWLPGVEFLGEGVFIMLDNGDGWHFPLKGNAFADWSSNDPAQYAHQVFRSPERQELHPVFIWWHTLAHMLLRVLSVDSGYSSSSIRERIYLEIESATGNARGGIVLYTVQPSADGTLGGLVSMVPHFSNLLSRVWELLNICSNDPLCLEQNFTAGNFIGSACYGCLFVSETSCEHRNMWLDRHLLLENWI